MPMWFHGAAPLLTVPAALLGGLFCGEGED